MNNSSMEVKLEKARKDVSKSFDRLMKVLEKDSEFCDDVVTKSLELMRKDEKI